MRLVVPFEKWMRRLRFSRPYRPATMIVGGCLGLAACLLAADGASAASIQLIASNIIYVDLAEQLGGKQISAFVADRNREAPSAIQSNSIVLCDSTRRDAWLRDAALRTSPPAMIVEVQRSRFEEGGDAQVPWYDAEAIMRFTHTLARELARREPSMASSVARNLAYADTGFQAINRRIDEIARDYAHSNVVVADTLSRAIARRLGFNAFPHRDATRAAVAEAIQQQEGSIVLYDRDAVSPAVKELINSAKDAGIPVVGLQERLPRGLHYQQWALRQWNTVHGALNEASP